MCIFGVLRDVSFDCLIVKLSGVIFETLDSDYSLESGLGCSNVLLKACNRQIRNQIIWQNKSPGFPVLS